MENKIKNLKNKFEEKIKKAMIKNGMDIDNTLPPQYNISSGVLASLLYEPPQGTKEEQEEGIEIEREVQEELYKYLKNCENYKIETENETIEKYEENNEEETLYICDSCNYYVEPADTTNIEGFAICDNCINEWIEPNTYGCGGDFIEYLIKNIYPKGAKTPKTLKRELDLNEIVINVYAKSDLENFVDKEIITEFKNYELNNYARTQALIQSFVYFNDIHLLGYNDQNKLHHEIIKYDLLHFYELLNKIDVSKLIKELKISENDEDDEEEDEYYEDEY